MLTIHEDLIHQVLEVLGDRVGSSNFKIRSDIWREIRLQEYKDSIIGGDVFADMTENLRDFKNSGVQSSHGSK